MLSAHTIECARQHREHDRTRDGEGLQPYVQGAYDAEGILWMSAVVGFGTHPRCLQGPRQGGRSCPLHKQPDANLIAGPSCRRRRGHVKQDGNSHEDEPSVRVKPLGFDGIGFFLGDLGVKVCGGLRLC